MLHHDVSAQGGSLMSLVAAALMLPLSACDHVGALESRRSPGDEDDTESDSETGTDTGTGFEEECWPDGDYWVSDGVEELSFPGGNQVVIVLEHEGAFYLELTGDPLEEVWLSMVETAASYDSSISLFIDKEGERVLDVTHPFEGAVQAIWEVDGGLEVAMDVSAAIHFLHETVPCYDLYSGFLEESLGDQTPVILTEIDLEGIVFVREPW